MAKTIEPSRARSRVQARIARERLTVLAMIRIHCRAHHHPVGDLCLECEALWAYVQQRLDRCPLKADKPTCNNCPVHCYKPEHRSRIREVMRFSGPRMLLHHPLLTLHHLVDGRRGLRSGKSTGK